MNRKGNAGMKGSPFPYLLLMCLTVCAPGTLSSVQEKADDPAGAQRNAIKVFCDVSRYMDYIKKEVPFVNYVRDRKEAQVHIMLTQRRTGSRGEEYTMTFMGQLNFTGLDDTLKYVSRQMDPEEIIRGNIVRIMKMGLMRYVSRTSLAEYITIDYQQRTDPAAVADKWNYWVFNIQTNNELNGEELSRELILRGSVSADRVTPGWKLHLNANAENNTEEYETEDRTISSSTRYRGFRGMIVKSIGEHWSAGACGSARSSVFENMKLSWNVAPAIEYNVFPYRESTRKEFRWLYRVDYTDIRYNEETIFFKTRENLLGENLSSTFEIKEKWGSVSWTMEGSHYFHDFKKNRLRLHTNVNLRLLEGFSLNIHGNITRIHDQLSLSGKDLTEEQILLGQRQLATNYDYFLSLGLRYTFGSIFSNVVNPRFGDD
ncbi:MAG: hypothetical protein Q8O92_02945 [Candidatus Latescibacter sp.]|nr:hypothetical protein [Candidatus Latescibacter sp.]